MILRFRHRGLQSLCEIGRRRVPLEQVANIERVLARLDEATTPADMDLPGLRLHALKGNRAGYWAVDISSNLQMVFRFEGAHASDADLVDYH